MCYAAQDNQEFEQKLHHQRQQRLVANQQLQTQLQQDVKEQYFTIFQKFEEQSAELNTYFTNMAALIKVDRSEELEVPNADPNSKSEVDPTPIGAPLPTGLKFEAARKIAHPAKFVKDPNKLSHALVRRGSVTNDHAQHGCKLKEFRSRKIKRRGYKAWSRQLVRNLTWFQPGLDQFWSDLVWTKKRRQESWSRRIGRGRRRSGRWWALSWSSRMTLSRSGGRLMYWSRRIGKARMHLDWRRRRWREMMRCRGPRSSGEKKFRVGLGRFWFARVGSPRRDSGRIRTGPHLIPKHSGRDESWARRIGPGSEIFRIQELMARTRPDLVRSPGFHGNRLDSWSRRIGVRRQLTDLDWRKGCGGEWLDLPRFELPKELQ